MMFSDRKDAGRQLALSLKKIEGLDKDTVVVALPRGGVPIGYEVAQELGIPLTTFIVRKLGAPHNSEFAIGALAQTGLCVLDENLVRTLAIAPEQIKKLKEKERAEALRRQKVYQAEGFPSLQGKTVIVVDDGIATGSTMLVALKALKELKPKQIILATPVASRDSIEKLRQYADQIVVLSSPEDFEAVGSLYAHFPQVEDDEVISLLKQANPIRKNE